MALERGQSHSRPSGHGLTVLKHGARHVVPSARTQVLVARGSCRRSRRCVNPYYCCVAGPSHSSRRRCVLDARAAVHSTRHHVELACHGRTDTTERAARVRARRVPSAERRLRAAPCRHRASCSRGDGQPHPGPDSTCVPGHHSSFTSPYTRAVGTSPAAARHCAGRRGSSRAWRRHLPLFRHTAPCPFASPLILANSLVSRSARALPGSTTTPRLFTPAPKTPPPSCR